MAGKSDDNLPDESKRTRPLRRRRGITPLPTLMGAVDVGSTAMRLNIAEYLPDHPLRFLEELTHPIAIGADTFRHGRILPETLFSICGIMDNFVRVMNDYGVKHRRAVTSSAVREAANRDSLSTGSSIPPGSTWRFWTPSKNRASFTRPCCRGCANTRPAIPSP